MKIELKQCNERVHRKMTELTVDLKQKWQRVSQRLRAELGDDLFTSWFGRMDAEDHSNLKLIVSVPTRFLKSWIENHYVAKLQIGRHSLNSSHLRLSRMPSSA